MAAREVWAVDGQGLNLIGELFLGLAVVVVAIHAVFLWMFVRAVRTGRGRAPSVTRSDTAEELLENEIDQLRGELYRLRQERDWLRRECARLARGDGETRG